MINKVENSTETYLVTPSLLNAWGYIWYCESNVKEAESDLVCLEDKILIAREKAYNDFLNALNRVSTPPNKYMLEGIKFEEECYKGNTCISPIIDNGSFQIVGKKEVNIDGMNFLMYGRLDVLKGGTIYDIKRVVRYSLPKYKNSYQHRFYLDLFPSAYKFTYLIYDGYKLHKETYYRDETIATEIIIHEFIEWLKQNNLIDLYKEKWKCKIY